MQHGSRLDHPSNHRHNLTEGVRRDASRPLLALFVLLATAAAGQSASVDDGVITGEVWIELDPIVRGPLNHPLTRDEAVELLLDEAQYVASGMVYGFSFVYEPGDPSRSVQESFQLEPHAIIVRGDPRLSVFQTWTESDRLFARFTYELDRSQLGWFNAWHGSAVPRSSGTGTSSLFGGQAARIDAIRDGVRAAVKEHVRKQELNRPQRITGAVLLADTPRLLIDRGDYEAVVDVYLQVDEVRRYTEY